MLFLRDTDKNGVSGYDLADELERQTGKRPSSAKIYPFLRELKESGIVLEEEGESRNKKLYHLSEKGIKLVDDLVERMRNIIDARLNILMEICHHCGVALLDPAVVIKAPDGSTHKFCCEHCYKASNEDH